jgi:prolyl oligopeptidase
MRLSIGGKDAVVTREFDLVTKTFVENGFNTSESKQSSGWINENQIMIATDFGEGSMNESGYARQVKIWTRGENLEDVEVVFDGDYKKIFSFPFSSIRPDGNYYGILEGPTFFTKVLYLFKDNELVKLDLPLRMDVNGTFKGSLIVSLDEDWRGYSSGSLVAVKIADALENQISDESIELIFAPSDKRFLRGVSLGRDEIYVSVMDNINGKILHYEKVGPNWSESEIRSFGNAELSVSSLDEWADHLFISSESFTEPTSLYYANADKDFEKIKSLPEKFDPEKYKVEQLYATSADGTEIPYFQVSNVGMEANSNNPTLLYGYGGFQISLTPSYLGSFARQWLDAGGVYVIANIRGGGEFGPEWHQSALKENRQRAYDDFIAVGETLISTGVTSSEHLGIRGGSNGGLLVGAVVAQRPDLFNAVICAVPLLDMYRYDKLLAGASWVDEYGDPDNPEEWSFISKYSPYQNVFADKNYPEIYFYTSTKDDRVHPGHARKMAKKMLDQGHEVIYYENIEGGHSAAANLKQSAYMTTLQLEYLKDKLL